MNKDVRAISDFFPFVFTIPLSARFTADKKRLDTENFMKFESNLLQCISSLSCQIFLHHFTVVDINSTG